MHCVQITGLTLIHKPRPNANGFQILAYFDVFANGIRIAGCSLVKTPVGGLTVWTPRIEADSRRAVDLVADSLQHEIKMRARDAYRALGGTELESIGVSRPLGVYEENRRTLREAL